MKSFKIPVKVGSHSINIYVNDEKISCENFIEIALIQCKVVKGSAEGVTKNYSLFERLNGIEVIINQDENIYNLWTTRWKNDANFLLIIKKFQKLNSLNKFIDNNQKNFNRISKVNKYLISTENKINKSQIRLKKKIRLFLVQDFLAQQNRINYPVENKQINNRSIHLYEEIDDGFFCNFKKILNIKCFR